MGLAEKHPTDEGKYQATYSKYGHGKGNGKSRSMIYKEAKKLGISQKEKKKENDFVQKDTVKETPKEIPEEPEYTKSSSFEDVVWLDEDEDLPPPTIAAPIRKLAGGEEGELSAVHRATQAQLVRWGYMGLDRGLTHWGRGVTGKEDWEINRHPSDYDALEASTMHVLDANGISINLSPTAVWGVVVSAAYGPPVSYIARNARVTPGRRIFGRIGDILMTPYRLLTRRRREAPSRIVDIDESEN